MANDEHLAILKQGVEAWNKWRDEKPGIQPDLRHADLRDAYRRDAYRREAYFSLAILNIANVIRRGLSDADLSNAKRISADLSDTDLRGANLNRASLSGADLSGAHLSGADLSHADLRDANLHDADLSGADLSRAHLSDANLSDAELINADLSDASLSDAYLSGADLSHANLGGAWLSQTNLSRANLQDADFSNAHLYRTVFADTDLSTAKGLESVRHSGPSSIGIDTIYKSAGSIPESFLRGCGVPDTFITFARSLVGKAIDFYSCFISFTEADDAISERLHNDLQAAGVRCWRWKEDAKWGKTLMRSIDEAVRVYDKLVVICSEQSLNAPAVIREIERALQKEDELARQGKDSEVLFPIRIDDYIFTGWNHHRKADVLAKNVGDFRNWHEPTNYRSKLDRLLSDLKAEESN